MMPKGNGKQKPENEGRGGNGPAPDTSFPPIPGVDTAKGISLTGGTAESYQQVLSMFRKDTEERMQKLRFFIYESVSSGDGQFPEKHLQSFATQIQALKSASATLGAAEISAEAARFEAAGKERNLTFIQDNLPSFVEHLAELVKNIRAAMEIKSKESSKKSGGFGFFMQKLAGQRPDKTSPSKTVLSEYLPVFQKLKEALEAQNISDIDQILDELNKKPLDSRTKEILEQISDQVLMTELSSAKKTVDELLASNK